MQKSAADSELTFQHDPKECHAAAGVIFQKRYEVENQIPMGWFKKIAPTNFARTLLLVFWINRNVF